MANNNVIYNKLDAFIKKYYKNQLIKGLLYFIGVFFIGYLSISVIEYFGQFNTPVRALLFCTFLSLVLFILIKYIIIPASKLYKLGAILSYEDAAAIIGKHFSNVQDKLINLLQLQSVNNLQHSVLLEAALDQRIREINPVPFSSAIDLSENKKYLKYVLPPVFIFLTLLLLIPKFIKEPTERILFFNKTFEKPAPYKFKLLNKNLEAVQYSDFTLDVKIDGNEVPEELFVMIDGAEFKLQKEKQDLFHYTIKNATKNLNFFFKSGEITSNEFELTVNAKPALTEFMLEINYPAYLAKPREVLKNTGDLILPEGTKVNWSMKTKNTSIVYFRWKDSNYVLPINETQKASFSKTLKSNVNYSIKTVNEKISLTDSMPYTITVIQDVAPSIIQEEKFDSIKRSQVLFSGIIKDDYGFSRLAFFYNIKNDSTKANGKLQKVDLGVAKGINQQTFALPFDFNSLTLKPGDEVDYYFEVADNDGVNGPKIARTSILKYKALTVNELEQRTEKNSASMKSEMEKALKQAKDLQKSISQINKDVLEKKNWGYEEKKKLQDMLDMQKQLTNKVEALKKQNDINNEQNKEVKEINEELLEKQKQLEELFKNIMTPEMKKLFDELQKMMEKLDKNQVQQALEKLEQNDKQMEKELDRTLELYKQFELEQKLQKNIDKLDQLAKEEKEQSKQSEDKNSDNKALQEKQEDLNKKFDDLKKDMQSAEEKNKDLENKNEMPDTKELQKETEQEMSKSSEKLSKNQKQDASKNQKSAAEKMQQMKEKMQASLDKMQKEQATEDAAALRQIMENLMNVSFEQERGLTKLKTTNINNPQYLKIGQNQKHLQDNMKMIEDSLFALSKRNPKISSLINKETGNINMQMEKAIEALEERAVSEAGMRQQASMTSINNLALLLNESLEQMQAEMRAQQKSNKSGDGSCDKPGGKGSKPKPSMSSLKKLQDKLNKQMQQMKEAMEKGDKPGQKPGDKNPNGQSGMGLPGNAQQLAQMAAQQEHIRREMQKALKEMEKQGYKDPGGQTASQMEETETELVNKKITEQTMKRQQDIMTRLLEHENAEREREFDEKRESNSVKQEILSNPSLFLEYKKLKEQENELLRTVPLEMTPFYKHKVSNYFNFVKSTK
jgi:hypothetical protein